MKRTRQYMIERFPEYTKHAELSGNHCKWSQKNKKNYLKMFRYSPLVKKIEKYAYAWGARFWTWEASHILSTSGQANPEAKAFANVASLFHLDTIWNNAVGVPNFRITVKISFPLPSRWWRSFLFPLAEKGEDRAGCSITAVCHIHTVPAVRTICWLNHTDSPNRTTPQGLTIVALYFWNYTVAKAKQFSIYGWKWRAT